MAGAHPSTSGKDCDGDLQLLADGCTALLRSVFGENNWYRWNEIKQHTQLDNLQAFITWMLDVAEQEINKPEPDASASQYGENVGGIEVDAAEHYTVEAQSGNVDESQTTTDTTEWAQKTEQNFSSGNVETTSNSTTDFKHESALSDYPAVTPSVSANDETSFDNAVEIFHDQKTFYCNSCAVTLTDMEVVREHLLLRHPQLPIAICCACCNQKFATVDDYVSYHRTTSMYSKSKKFNFICDYCAKAFSARQFLEDHIANKHLKLGPRHPCPNCEKKFSHFYDMTRHKKTCPQNVV